MMFCVLVGTGVQLFLMAIITIIFAAVGFLSPANRGSLMISVLVLFVMMGSSPATRRHGCTRRSRATWHKCTMYTAFMYPGFCFLVFMTFDALLFSYGSTGAVPILSLLALLALWFGISVPLVFLGAYFGYTQPPFSYPVITSNIPRSIPDQPWYLSTLFTTAVGGILPFGACFVELFFILSSMWMNQYYYVFGFTLLVFVILIITCCEITIVLCSSSCAPRTTSGGGARS